MSGLDTPRSVPQMAGTSLGDPSDPGRARNDPESNARRLHDHDQAARQLGVELTGAGLGSATARMTVRDDMQAIYL